MVVTTAFSMFRRAGISFGIASIIAVFGFTGILETTAPIARVLFYVATAFSALSLVFSLFEESATSSLRNLESPSGPYQLALDLGLKADQRQNNSTGEVLS